MPAQSLFGRSQSHTVSLFTLFVFPARELQATKYTATSDNYSLIQSPETQVSKATMEDEADDITKIENTVCVSDPCSCGGAATLGQT